MATAQLKTRMTNRSPESFLAKVKPDAKREDCLRLFALLKKVTGETPRMWGSSIVGFGTFHYKGKSGREGEWFLTGLSPRKQNITVYVIAGFKHFPELMAKLGKHSTGSSCLYIRSLADIRVPVLKQILEKGMRLGRKLGVPQT